MLPRGPRRRAGGRGEPARPDHGADQQLARVQRDQRGAVGGVREPYESLAAL